VVQAGDGLGGGLLQRGAFRFGRAAQVQRVDADMRGEMRQQLARAAAQEVHHARRQVGSRQHFGERQPDGRRIFGQQGDHRVAADNRRGKQAA
jgi:hypothetical protein